MAANPCQVPGADAATSKSGVVRPYSTTSAPVPPPVPHRSSARQRRFSVYGGGDEYASLTTVLPSSSAQRSQNMILDPQRQMPLRSRTQPTLAINGKGMTMFNHHFGMEGKAPLSVNDAMAQRADGDLFSLTSRMSWCAGVVALRSVHEEEDELTAVGAAAPPARTRSSTLLSMPVRHSHRHSSYTSCRSKDDGHDYIQQLDRINVNNSHQLLGEVQPEWEKFAMGLGGHTIV
ncbi:hypothetical protein SEPCBS119000_003207 [Sporothrix epigloea]|uniref:Uncharacterized protein n=1 Tax=Sporothrix epigloea TaxID=1892477 RepID=A0ABP0DNU0_9PEZI